MNFFGKLNARLGALAQGTVGAVFSKVDRLDEWTPDTPPERTDYSAIWREVVAPLHPVIDARVRLRTVDRNVLDRYACREAGVTVQLDALDMRTKGDLAAETLKRYAFLDYCVYYSFNRNRNAPLTALDNFGLPQDALVALEGDFENLARSLLRPGLQIDAEQTGAIARVMTFAGPLGPSASSIRQFIHYVQPLFCTPQIASDDRKKLALLRLFNALGDSADLRAYPDMSVTQFVEALANTIGVAPETHPLVQQKLAAAALVEDGRQAVVKLGGPRLEKFFEAAYAHQNYNSRKYVQEHADLSALDALSPEDRALTLFDCLRVFNFTVRSSTHARAKTWPDVRLTGFDRAAYPNLGKYASEVFSAQVLDQLFTALARKKMTLSEPMQQELLVLFRSGAAPNMLLSLQVVKIVEGFAKDNSSAAIRKEVRSAIDWLKTSDDFHVKKFKAGAVHRLEKALESMAAPTANAPVSMQPAAPTAASAPPQGFGLRLPGGFGRRSEPPGEASVKVAPASAHEPGEEAPLPPLSKPEGAGRPASLVDFYGDLADLRKCSAEHLAFLDEQIAGETDIEAEARRRISIRPMLRGLTEEQQANMAAAIRADVVREREKFRALMEMIKRRVQAIASLGPAARAVWPAFHDHARALYGKSKPAAAWSKRAQEILRSVAEDDQVAALRSVITAYPCSTAHYPTDDVVRGLIYCGRVGCRRRRSVRRLPISPARNASRRSPDRASATSGWATRCLWTLINMPDGGGIPYLARLLNRVKYPSVKKVINAALDEAAEKAGLSRGALDELSVPTHELENGRREIALGRCGRGGDPRDRRDRRCLGRLPARRRQGDRVRADGAQGIQGGAEGGEGRGEGDRGRPHDADRAPAAHLAGEPRLEL